MKKVRFSEYFNLNKSQVELDFVDIYVDGDKLLFVDPYFISRRKDEWSVRATEEIRGFFQKIIENISNPKLCKKMLKGLNEPNETKLGWSKKESNGKGIGEKQADTLYKKLSNSEAVKTGFIQDISECELMVEGISDDKISDMTINIIKKYLIEYTQMQCENFNIKMYTVPSGLIWNMKKERWENYYVKLPMVNNKKILLVPKWIVVQKLTLNSQEYCLSVLELLLFPYLVNPKKEDKIHEGRKRIDITFLNAANTGFFIICCQFRILHLKK